MSQQLGRTIPEDHDAGLPGNLTAFHTSEGTQAVLASGVPDEAALSYELRTLLGIITLISGNLELLYERLSDGQRRKMICDLRTYTRKLNDLIDAVLAPRRQDGGPGA